MKCEATQEFLLNAEYQWSYYHVSMTNDEFSMDNGFLGKIISKSGENKIN